MTFSWRVARKVQVMMSKANRSNRRLPRSWPTATVSVSIMQASFMRADARKALLHMNSPCQSTMPTSAVLAMRPPAGETSEDVECDWVRTSLSQAYLSTRNRLLYTAHAVGSHGSRRCEQQVCRHFPTLMTRLPPVHTLNHRQRLRWPVRS